MNGPIRIAKVVLLVGSCGILFAQPPASPVRVDLVKTGLYVFYGPAGNTLLRLTADGLVLVDGQPEDYFARLLQKAERIAVSEQPVRALILTHEDAQGMGANSKLAAQGTRIIVQAHLAARMAPNPALFTFDREYMLQGGGVQVRLLHFGNEPTSGATVVYFPAQKVVAVGELLTADLPGIHSLSREKLAAWDAALAEILKLDFDLVVPAKGPLATRHDLEIFKLRMDELSAR